MFTPLKAKEFGEKILQMDGISKRAVEEHLKLYSGYITKYNEINESLAKLTADDLSKANQSYSLVRELKVELTFAWGGIYNHELYFGHLGGIGGQPKGELLAQIEKDFGSFDSFKSDAKATAIAARGWVWLAWDSAQKRLFNFIGDAQNSYPVWGATPILAIDTYEHAYFMDFGSARAAYIDAFFKNVSWEAVEKNWSAVVK